MSSRTLALAAALLLPAAARAAEPVAAVLSSGGGAYLEAFSAFQASYGAEVKYFDLSREMPELPPGTKVVVTFGAKAAAQPYPPGIAVVYAISPGYFLPARSAPAVKISMRAAPAAMLAKLAYLQPGLRRLTIFWASPGYSSFPEEYSAAARQSGLDLTAIRVESPDRLPALLRGALGRADAIWLPPDPLLITSETFRLFREFSWGNAIPLYASTKGLAREGACGAVGVSFAESGAAAAAAVRSLLEDGRPPELIHPDRMELSLNASAARRCGLALPAGAAREAAYFFP